MYRVMEKMAGLTHENSGLKGIKDLDSAMPCFSYHVIIEVIVLVFHGLIHALALGNHWCTSIAMLAHPTTAR